MDLTKPTYITFLVSAIIAMLAAMFLEKVYLIFAQLFTVLTILLIYFTEKKESISILYILSQIIGVVCGVLLVLGLRDNLKAVSILFSIFYIFYLRMMYVRNAMKKGEAKTYFYVALIYLPIFYIYYSVIEIILPELKEVVVYFSFLLFFMLSYLITALYYYIKDKNQSNLWMLIAAINLGFMNIIICLNEFYMYETMFTVIVVLCSLFIQFFVLKFMLYDENKDDLSLIDML